MKNLFIIILLINSIVFAQSINKKYFVEKKISGGSKTVGEFNTVDYSIETTDNNVLYTISNKTDYDIPYSGIEVFNNGNSVLINSFYGTLTFFNNKGVKTKTTKLSDSLGFEYERNIRSVIDNNSLLVIFKEENKDYSFLQKYDSNGKLEKRLTLNETNITGIAYSESLDQIYISFIEWNNNGTANKKISLINEDGQLLKRYNDNFEKGYFAKGNRFIAFSNKSLLSINTQNLDVVFRNKSTTNKLYLDVTVINSNIVVAMASAPKLQNGKWVYNNSTILKLDSSGKIIERQNINAAFSDFGFRKSGSTMQFITDNKTVLVR